VDTTKNASRHIMSNLCFCIQCDLQVAYYILVQPRREMSTQYFSCSGGPSVNYRKITLGPVMLNLCFVSTVICGSCGVIWCIWAPNVDALFLMLGWVWYRFHKK
jgi:hypothetical protein